MSQKQYCKQRCKVEIETEPFYRDGQFYDLLHVGFLKDKDFFVEEAVRLGGPVLEVACGTGRITIPIAQKGIEIVGLDISPGMLAQAKKKSIAEKLKIEWVHADCRNFNLNRKFKFIFIPFNSMQHLHDQSSLEAFFQQVKKHLAPGGTFVIDVFNPSLSLLNRNPTERFEVMDVVDSVSGEQIYIEEMVHYNATTQINHIKWYYSVKNKKDFRVDELNLRCFFPQELDMLVQYNGFEIIQKFGDFKRGAFTNTSMKQILVLKAVNRTS